jgi:hypothetical protein
MSYDAATDPLKQLISTPDIPAGMTKMVSFERAGVASKITMMFLADAPVAGAPLGQVGEGHITTSTVPEGELNNSFALPWNREIGNPQTYLNPLVY